MKIDASNLKRNIDRANEIRRVAREAFLRNALRPIGKNVVDNGPRDTNRYVRGWAVALKEVGAFDGPVPEIQAGSKEENILNALQNQVEWWQTRVDRLQGTIDAWYPPGKRKRKGYFRKLERELRKATKSLEAAKATFDQAKANTGFVVFDIGRGAVYDGKYRPQKRRATIRIKVYGGTGKMLSSDEQTTVYLKNLEAHARVVERRTPGLQQQTKALAGQGIKRPFGTYVRTIANAMGKEPKGV